MSYFIELTPEAISTIERWPQKLRPALRVLKEDPTALSFRASPPYPPTGQMYEYHFDLDGEPKMINVRFKYRDDEQTLVIVNVGYVDYAP